MCVRGLYVYAITPLFRPKSRGASLRTRAIFIPRDSEEMSDHAVSSSLVMIDAQALQQPNQAGSGDGEPWLATSSRPEACEGSQPGSDRFADPLGVSDEPAALSDPSQRTGAELQDQPASRGMSEVRITIHFRTPIPSSRGTNSSLSSHRPPSKAAQPCDVDRCQAPRNLWISLLRSGSPPPHSCSTLPRLGERFLSGGRWRALPPKP